MLGQITHGNYEQGAGVVHNPRVVRFGIGYFGRQTQPTVGNLPDVTTKHGERHLKIEGAVVLPFGKGRGIAGVQYIDPFVIGEEGHAGMEAGG